MQSKIIWFTDSHLLPFQRYKFLNHILDAAPHGVFLTGDVSHSGFSFLTDLEFLGKRLKCPLYFVEGNHDAWLSSFQEVRAGIRKLCSRYPNLIWMTEAGVVPLTDEVAVIGASGFYTAEFGNPNFIKCTFDWFMIKELRELPSWEARYAKFRQLAAEDTAIIVKNLEKALEVYNRVYILSHYPGWKEADRHDSFLSEEFWKPYNTNGILGAELERVMKGHKIKGSKKHITVLSGHTHRQTALHISNSIECRVGRAGYFGPTDNETLFI